VVFAAQNGRIKYHKAFGNYEYDAASLPVTLESIYDLASVTKTSATTVAIMKLYEQGKVDLKGKISDYLSWTAGSDKGDITIADILLHQAGLYPFIPFYKETLDSSGAPKVALYAATIDTSFSIPVARNLYLRKDWNDTLFQRILKSPLTAPGKYVYSDNDFIFLGKIVEAITGMTLDEYTRKTFYHPLGMATTGFNPWKTIGSERVVPTEQEKNFRRQLTRGYVHDEGASLFGGVSGHAGLFSNAYDLSLLYQMLLNGGELNGQRFLKPETVALFTAYQSNTSRRGYGFDKPEKDSLGSKGRYPSLWASPQTYGHTGFTGTCVWVDPETSLVYIFLSNRVYPTRDNNKLGQMGIRGAIQDAIYKALKQDQAGVGVAPNKTF
jgi:CubicO group peptidase (beta-lactamase class C family)